MKATTARIIWFDDKKGYGLAMTPEGQRLFVHYRNFVRGQKRITNCLVQGATIECEIPDVADDLTDALNAGSLRDSGLNHRRPRAPVNLPTRNPSALRIRVVESCGR